MKKNIKIKQLGFLLPAAIFLLVILAGLGAYAVNITSIQQNSATQDIQSIRAYHLAKAGAELSAYYLMQTSPDSTSIPATCHTNASTTISLDGFSIARSCYGTYVPYYEQGNDHEIGVYTVKSTASFGTSGDINYVERQFEFNLSKCRDTSNALVPAQC